MIQDRVRGIGNLATACQCVAVLATFWIWILIYSTAVPGGEGISLRAYAGYSLLIVLGLLLDSFILDKASPSFSVRQPSAILLIPRALRQTTVTLGFLLFILFLNKDAYASRVFLLGLIPALFLALSPVATCCPDSLPATSFAVDTKNEYS